MDGRNTAGMSGAPGLEQVERFPAADFADDHAVGSQAQGRAHELGHADNAGAGAQRHVIACRALQLDGVFENDDAVAGAGDLGEQRVGERRLAGARAAGDQDVESFAHGLPQECRLGRRQNPVGDVVVEPDDPDRALAQGKGRARGDRWQARPRSARPSPGSSAVKSGLPAWTSVRTCAATSRMMRSPSAAESCIPIGARPLDSRSIQSEPSGFNMISTTSGSSSASAITGPIAVRSMRIRRSSDVACGEIRSVGLRRSWRLTPRRSASSSSHSRSCRRRARSPRQILDEAVPRIRCRPNCSMNCA